MSNDSHDNNEETILLELRKGASGAFEKVYKQYYPMIIKVVTSNGGSSIEAQDVFQEVLFILVKKIRDPEFTLNSKLSSYIFAIGRNIWYKRTRGTHGKTTFVEDEKFSKMDLTLEENELEKVVEKEQKLDLLEQKISELSPVCQQLIKLSVQQNLSQKEIAETMGLSPQYVKVKKYRCLKSLKEKISETTFFKNL